MSYFLFFSLLISVLAVMYVWYLSHRIHAATAAKVLQLSGDDNHLLSDWYQSNIKPSLKFDVDDNEVASRFLKSFYNIDISPNQLIVGTNLIHKFYEVARNDDIAIITSKYIPKSNNYIFDLRSILGIPNEIAIINNSYIRQLMKKNNNANLTQLDEIMDSELASTSYNYLSSVLKYRWQKIKSLNMQILNNEGSYLYLDTNAFNQNIINEKQVRLYGDDGQFNIDDDILYNNINGLRTNQGIRINLLCSDIDFEELINRLSQD